MSVSNPTDKSRTKRPRQCLMRAATIQCTPGFVSATKQKIRERSYLVDDVSERSGDIDQQAGMTAELFLGKLVRRTRSRLWDMTSLGLHRSTPTCGSFLRSQRGGPRIRAAASPATVNEQRSHWILKKPETQKSTATLGEQSGEIQPGRRRMQRRTRDTKNRAKIRTTHQWPLSRQNHATTSDRIPSDSGVPPASTNE